jgi:hypothetical protein
MNEPPTNIHRIADALNHAKPVHAKVVEAPELAMVTTSMDPDPGEPNAKGEGPGTWLPNRLGLPPDCPITPLGVDGDTYYFLDTIGQLRALGCREFSKMSVLSLFMGRQNYLYWGWPRFNKEGKTTSFANDDVAATLMAACAAKGPWTPTDRVRGRGAWCGSKGDLIIHAGLHMWMYGRETATGEHGRYVYPKRPPALVPWPQRIEHENNPARILLPILRRWNWERPDLDPVLMLGWIAAAMIGGALEWRAMAYITGGSGTGKSTLQKLTRRLFGEGMFKTSNTTAAGIYNLIKEDSVPVAIDEGEAGEDNRRAKAILELARQASSGDKGFRSTDRGESRQFTIQSAFLFSSINAPPMLPQDLSRFALLKLKKIDPSNPSPTLLTDEQAALMGRERAGELTDDEMSKLGRMVLRRMVDGWSALPAMLKAYREVLRAAGHNQRGQDTFGTLLACANILVGDSFEELEVAMGEDIDPWREKMAADGLSELEGATDNWLDCLEYMLSAPVDAYRQGTRLTIGRVILGYYDKDDGATTMQETRDKLAQAGVGLSKDGQWLAIPNKSPLLYRIFHGSVWAGDAGASVWPGALKQGPSGTVWETGHCRINGVNCRCTMISLRALYGANGLMSDTAATEPML